MATRVYLCVVYAVLTVSVSAHSSKDDSKYCTCNEELINRRGFPDGFVFGSASAAYQIEGAYNESGKGLSMWDHFTHTYPEKITDRSNGDVAVDSYHLYKEDVKLLKDMGVDAYKFSISWTRILPGGAISKGVNQDGINYYNNLINELLANGIQPWVTILHLDTPQALENAYGGFLSPQIVSDFQDFANLLFSLFGDRVKYWITINEPWGFSYFGYTQGEFAPGRCSDWISNGCTGGDSGIEPYKVMHSQLLAHAAAVKLYRSKYQEVQKGKIGIAVNTFWFVASDQTHESLSAKDRALDFMLGWVMDPITFGRYPKSMRTRVRDRLPKFTKQEAEMVKGSFDFVGLNYYSANYAIKIDQPTNNLSYITDSGAIFTGEKDGIPIGEQGSTNSPYYIYPKGLRKTLQYIKENYNDPLIYVTENGVDEDRNDSIPISEAIKDYKRKDNFPRHIPQGLDEDRNDSIPISEAIKDYKRKDNFLHHLCCLREAIKEDGVNVKGFFAWSLMDNFEWASGYSVRFGLNYVDFGDKSLRRYPKVSAQWFKSILAKRTNEPQSRRISDH